MTWAKLDDRLYDDPRCEAAGAEAMGLWVMALSYMGAYHTDGWISLTRCRRLVGSQHGRRLALRLVAAGWWEAPEVGDGDEPTFRLLGWEKYLIPAEEAGARSARAAEAGRRGGRARGAKEASPGQGEHQDRHQGQGQGEHQDPPPDPRSYHGPFSGNHAEALDTWQATRAPDPDPTPTRPDPRAPARDHAREIVQGEGLLFPDLEAPPAAAAKKPAKKASTPKVKPAAEPPPPPRERPAAERYLEAYVQGLANAGHAITPPPASDGKRLGAACAVHARDSGEPIVGEALIAWIRATAAQFRRAVSRPEVHRGGLTVHGFIAWLDNGRPVQPPTFRARAEADDFARPQDSDSWPEAQLVPPAEYVPPPPRSAELPPHIKADVDELAKLSPAELERRIQNARGFAGYGAL